MMSLCVLRGICRGPFCCYTQIYFLTPSCKTQRALHVNFDSLWFQTPGVLIAKKSLFRNESPLLGGGGGSVFFVTEKDQVYLKDPEVREESGTPPIVESIRLNFNIPCIGCLFCV